MRLLADAVNEVLACPEQPDGGDRRTQCLEVRWQEALPEILVEREEEHRHPNGDEPSAWARRDRAEIRRLVPSACLVRGGGRSRGPVVALVVFGRRAEHHEAGKKE